MGVSNLMDFVRSATSKKYLSSIVKDQEKTVIAVDISHWIYRACYACPEVLYHRNSMQVAYKIILNYIDNYVKLLRKYDIKLIFVFDGMKLPAKQVTHQERALRKKEAREMVEKFLARGNKSEARKHMLRCVEVKFDIVQQVIEYCKREKIDYIVAPYEADAQLAYLMNKGLCEFIITEDTDLILYGCKKIIYKLDLDGHCVLYDREKLGKCMGLHEVSFEKFRRICILSGCDYLKNIPHVGLQSAKKFFLQSRQDDVRQLLPKLGVYLKSKRLIGKVTPEYVENFIKAEETFKHHIVYDPITERLTPLEAYPMNRCSSDYPLAGKKFHHIQARSLVKGDINLDDLNPEADLDDSSSDEDEENEELEKEQEDVENQQQDKRQQPGPAVPTKLASVV